MAAVSKRPFPFTSHKTLLQVPVVLAEPDSQTRDLQEAVRLLLEVVGIVLTKR